jgi:hypothetical protein
MCQFIPSQFDILPFYRCNTRAHSSNTILLRSPNTSESVLQQVSVSVRVSVSPLHSIFRFRAQPTPLTVDLTSRPVYLVLPHPSALSSLLKLTLPFRHICPTPNQKPSAFRGCSMCFLSSMRVPIRVYNQVPGSVHYFIMLIAIHSGEIPTAVRSPVATRETLNRPGRVRRRQLSERPSSSCQ